MSTAQATGVWIISALAIGAILTRPWRIPEWVWACLGAIAIVASGAVRLGDAAGAVARGLPVYAFLIGITLLAEIARREHLFDWLARWALHAGRSSQGRLFAIIFGVGIVVTVFLSNDTTAIVLTPAVFAALARTDADPMPYLYACAFVANAASFMLPISNPANLVVFGHALPAAGPWIAAFGLAAVAAIVLTYLSLRLTLRGPLALGYRDTGADVKLTRGAEIAGFAIAGAIVILLTAAGLGFNVGYAALLAALLALAASAYGDRAAPKAVARHFAWQVVPLVAGLFVIVAGLDRSGALDAARHLLAWSGAQGFVTGRLALAAIIAAACNIFNNLPVALAAGYAIQSSPVSTSLAHAAVVAVDLSPNLSITGSLATLLWLIALRREGLEVTPLQFLRLGIVTVVPALVASVLLVR